MSDRDHFHRLRKYYSWSKYGYSVLLWDSKHFGFYPSDREVDEKDAQVAMQDRLADSLEVREDDRVLDAGCGRGVVPVHLAEKYRCTIDGIDIIPFEIERAKQRAGQRDVSDRVTFQVMNYADMAFPDDTFDCVYTMESLSHAPRVKAVLQELRRVTKPGGRIALFEYTIAADDAFTRHEKRILNAVAEGSAMDGLTDFRHNQFQHVLEDCGFSNVTVENISQHVLPSLRRLRKYAILPYYLVVKPLGLYRRFPNITSAVAFYQMAENDKIRYNIFTATT